MSKLDEIFKFTGISNAAKAGAIQDIKALFLELIGEDEVGGYARGVQPVRNKFRTELRKKVEEL